MKVHPTFSKIKKINIGFCSVGNISINMIRPITVITSGNFYIKLLAGKRYSHESSQGGKETSYPELQIFPLRLWFDTDQKRHFNISAIYLCLSKETVNGLCTKYKENRLTESDVDSCFGMIRVVT